MTWFRTLRVAIVGCGAIGSRRAHAAHAHEGSNVVCVVDTHHNAAKQLSTEIHTNMDHDWHTVVNDPGVDAVCIATPNSLLADITIASLRAGKHVLVEKPMGRNLREAQSIADEATSSSGLLKIGFNHRYHPALQRAYELYENGAIGDIINIRGRYGHGGRPGYENEWRCDPAIAGGGEVLDQGAHLADLVHWFLGIPVKTASFLQTAVWPIQPLEDNGFALFQFNDGQVASIHSGWTQWKSLFSFEIFGTNGCITIQGLGGSYGSEVLTLVTRKPEGGAPEIETTEWEQTDDSWTKEWDEFLFAIHDGEPYHGTPADGVAAMRIIDSIYRSANTGQMVSL